MRPTHRPEPKQKTIETPASQSSSTSSNSDAKPTSGGYYLDDGPGENAPADIDSIPSASLKTESPSKRANRPYSALGQSYTPMTVYAPYKKQGMASWYGKRYHGKKTSTGEIYDMYAMSAAHTILPIPSYAKVTNPANGRSVIVRINDRGPFKRDRLIDLSYAAAYQLRLIKQGSGLVEVETIDTSAEALQNMSNNKAMQASTLQTNPAEENTPAIVESAPAVAAVVTTPASKTTMKPAIISATSTLSSPYYIQVGAFKNEANGELLQKKIQGLDLVENVGIANVYNNGLYRVKLGPYASKKEADSSAAKIRRQLNIITLIINQ
ncbi:MAG: septal ring lytic transglycosylase RlpA family protein [Methylotenera sp.]|nr:septal ring lytic transglycosylase RlpA family protein [Methylotenera sp.]